MKKFKFVLGAIFAIALIGSCTMTPWDEIIGLDVAPTLIQKTPKLYPGGNAECSTINIPGLIQTTGRINYNQSTDSFEGAWPKGLLVMVSDDKSVAFQIDGAIDLGDGKCYKIGAVIVKGSDASNVYDYTDIGGVLMDKGLVSPINSSGGPAALSNLTFCFMECPPVPKVVAVKVIRDASEHWVSTTDGTDFLTAYNFLPGTYNLYSNGQITSPLGNLIIQDFNSDGNPDIKLINTAGFLYGHIYLYVGNPSAFDAINLVVYGAPQFILSPAKTEVIIYGPDFITTN